MGEVHKVESGENKSQGKTGIAPEHLTRMKRPKDALSSPVWNSTEN